MSSIASALILGGLSGLGGIFSSKKTTSDSSTTTNPNFSPQQQQLIDLITKGYGSAVADTPRFNQAYETGGVRNYLTNSINANNAANSVLSARGINRTTAGAHAVADTGYQEGNNIASFLANAPIAEQQNTTDLLSKAGGFTTSLPTGSTSTSHTTSVGNAPINPVAGFLGGGAQGLAAVLGQQNAATNLANILKSLPSTSISPSTTVNNNPPFGTSVTDPNNILGGGNGTKDNWW